MWDICFDVNCNQCGQTSCLDAGYAIQTCRNLQSNSLCCHFFLAYWCSICSALGLEKRRWTKLSSTFILLSLITSISSFVKIYLRLRQHQTQVQNNFPQGRLSELGNQLNIARYKKTVSSILWVQFALLVCYVPYGILAGTKMLDNVVPKMATETMIFMNSSLNPVLYCWKIGEVRKKVKGIIGQLWCC